MANVKITTLTNLQAPADADRFIIDDISDTETKSVTFANLKAQIDTIAISNTNTVSSNVDAVESRRVANIAGAVSSILTSDLTASRALVSGSGGKVEVSAVTSTELGHLDGVNGAIQTQLNSITTNINTLDANADAIESKRASNAVIQTAIEARRVANIAGAVSSITTADLTVNRALVSGSGGKVEVSAVTSTELAHLDGVSGAIQTQLDAKAALAGATFTGQVNLDDDLVITGNLTVSGDTTISEITAVESRRASNAVIQTAIEAR